MQFYVTFDGDTTDGLLKMYTSSPWFMPQLHSRKPGHNSKGYKLRIFASEMKC